MAWVNIAGMVFVAAGIVLGIFVPKVTAVYGGDETDSIEYRNKVRYYASISLVLIGTFMQIVANLPRELAVWLLHTRM